MILQICTLNYRNAEQYNTNAGYLYAAPKAWHKNSVHKGILDWALIYNTCTDSKNKVGLSC